MRAAVSELVTGAFPARVSVGWAVGAAGEDAAEVWTRANTALGRAKREGRNRVAGSITGRPAAAPGRGWTTLLSRTLASQQIHPVYQPIVTLPETRIVAYEGLARPVNLDGADSVEEFFATAHRLGVTNELDWICRRAVVRGAEGIRSDAQLYLNIDLSAVSDVDEDVEQMRSLLRWIGRPPANVVLEIADADRFSNLGQLSARVDAYRRAGFKIGIDDTGRPGDRRRPPLRDAPRGHQDRCQRDQPLRGGGGQGAHLRVHRARRADRCGRRGRGHRAAERGRRADEAGSEPSAGLPLRQARVHHRTEPRARRGAHGLRAIAAAR